MKPDYSTLLRRLILYGVIVYGVFHGAFSHAQTATVSLPGPQQFVANVSWTAPSACNSTTPCLFQVYRIAGTCPTPLDGSPGWTLVATTSTQVGSYVDNKVPSAGVWAYAIYPVQGTTQGQTGACGSGTIKNGLSPATNVVVAGQ